MLVNDADQGLVFVDSHAHIEGPKFAADRDEAIKRAHDAGVARMLTVGQVGKDWQSMEASLRLAVRYPSIVTSVGMHPHDAQHFTDAVGNRMQLLARHARVVAWGECGLDFYYDNSPRDVQRSAFREQIRLAREIGLPVIVHSRDAADETLEILEAETDGSADAGVFHCFSYDAHVAEAAVGLGFLVSFSGIVTFPTAGALREAARSVPLDRVLIETDSPFLAPVPHRGKRNEPAYVVHVAETLARLRNISVAEVAAATTANFDRLFRLRH